MTKMSDTEFEAFLGAQFRTAERESGRDGEAFARRVQRRLSRSDRGRFLILGGAAAAGAVIAATQLQRLFELVPMPQTPLLNGAVSPATLTLTVMAVLVSAFAVGLQRRMI